MSSRGLNQYKCAILPVKEIPLGFPILVRQHLYIESGPWCPLPGLLSWYPISSLIQAMHVFAHVKKTFALLKEASFAVDILNECSIVWKRCRGVPISRMIFEPAKRPHFVRTGRKRKDVIRTRPVLAHNGMYTTNLFGRKWKIPALCDEMSTIL